MSSTQVYPYEMYSDSVYQYRLTDLTNDIMIGIAALDAAEVIAVGSIAGGISASPGVMGWAYPGFMGWAGSPVGQKCVSFMSDAIMGAWGGTAGPATFGGGVGYTYQYGYDHNWDYSNFFGPADFSDFYDYSDWINWKY
ncbi:MAG: hypothetical protein AB9866_14875 [Syntrophobacteraceae bacterium]